jgi:hypothetical protein
MTQPLALEPGKTYFSLFYIDEQRRFPIVDTLIYLGQDVIEGERGMVPGHLFQYAASYHSDGNWNEMSDEEREQFDEPPVIAFEDAHQEAVMDAEGLVKALGDWRERTR